MGAFLTLLPQLIGGKIFGISISSIVAWLATPQGAAAISVAKGLLANLQANGASELEAGRKILAMFAGVHTMTPEEEKIWADRAANVGPGGG
jgi:hypothetical protein